MYQKLLVLLTLMFKEER